MKKIKLFLITLLLFNFALVKAADFELKETIQYGYKIALKDFKKGIYDTRKKELITPIIYDKIEKVDLWNERIAILTLNNKKEVFHLSKKATIVPLEYEDISVIDLENYVVKKNNNFGLVNAKPENDSYKIKTTIPFMYKKLNCKCNFCIGYKNKNFGIIDYSNKKIIPFEFQNIIAPNCLYAIIEKNNKKGIYSFKENKIIFEPKYDDIIYSKKFTPNNCYLISNNKKYIYLKENNFLEIDSYIYKNQKTIFPIKNKKMGLIKNGELIIPMKYQEIEETVNNWNIAKKNNKWGIISKEKTIVSFEYDDIKRIGNYFYVKKDNKYGILDNSKTILPANYDSIEMLSGCFLTSKNSKKSLYCKKDKLEANYDNISKLTKINTEDKNIYFVAETKNKKELWILKEEKLSKIFNENYDDFIKYENKFIVKNNGKYALVKENDLEKIKFKYKNAQIINIFETDMLKVKRGIISYPNEPKKVTLATIKAPIYGISYAFWYIFRSVGQDKK